MKIKVLISLISAVCILATACGKTEESSTAEISSAASGKKLTAVAVTAAPEKHSTTKVITAISPSPGYTYYKKGFSIRAYGASLLTNVGWNIISGGVATNSQSDQLYIPGVIQYLDTKSTISVDAKQSFDEKDVFLAITEESYLKEYGNKYDTINITSFKHIDIKEYNSLEVKADVVIDGESYKMTNIISNNVEENTIIWTLLDADGAFPEFNLADSITYPNKKIDDLRKRAEEFRNINRDDFIKYKTDN